MPHSSGDDGCDELLIPLDRVMEIFCFLLIALVGGLAGVGVFIYHMKKGQFEDPEDPKYQMFRDDE